LNKGQRGVEKKKEFQTHYKPGEKQRNDFLKAKDILATGTATPQIKIQESGAGGTLASHKPKPKSQTGSTRNSERKKKMNTKKKKKKEVRENKKDEELFQKKDKKTKGGGPGTQLKGL